MPSKKHKNPFEMFTGKNPATASLKKTCAKVLHVIHTKRPSSMHELSLYLNLSQETLKIAFEALQKAAHGSGNRSPDRRIEKVLKQFQDYCDEGIRIIIQFQFARAFMVSAYFNWCYFHIEDTALMRPDNNQSWADVSRNPTCAPWSLPMIWYARSRNSMTVFR